MVKRLIFCVIFLFFSSLSFAGGNKDSSSVAFQEEKPSYGEGGGSGAANLPLPEEVGESHFVNIKNSEKICKKGKLKIKKKKGEIFYYLKVKKEGSYNLALNIGKEEAAAFKNKKVEVKGYILEDSPNFIYVETLAFEAAQ